MVYVTFFAGIVTCLLQVLIVIGFRRFVNSPRKDAIDNIGTGVWLMAFTVMCRFLTWDVLYPFLGKPDWMSQAFQSHINLFFVFCGGAASLCILKGYLMLVEKKEPGHYNILTCVFYPHKLRLWIVMGGKDDKLG